MEARQRTRPRGAILSNREISIGGDDVPKLEPKRQFRRLTIWTVDPIIKKLRGMYKDHPEWFETPKPKSDKGKNEVDYSFTEVSS